MNPADSSAIPAPSQSAIEAVAQQAAQRGVNEGVAAERKRTTAILMALFIQNPKAIEIVTALNLITGQALTVEKLAYQIAAQ